MPFHYYLELRADWIKRNVARESVEPYKVHIEGELDDFHAEGFKGGLA